MTGVFTKQRLIEMKIHWFLFLIMTLSLLAMNSVQADFLYAVTLDEELLSINPATGAGTLVGMLDTAMDGFDLADLDTAIYTFDQNADKLQQLDPATGRTTETIDIGVVTSGEGALTFRSDGIGFLARSFGDSAILWNFDMTNPGSNFVGTLEFGIDGLDFNADGVLYGLSQTYYNLYIIDQSTAAPTLVGSTGLVSLNVLGGLTFSSDGTLYAALNDALYTLDPATGAATLIGPIGFNNVSGLTAVVPVPGAVILCGIGAGLISILRRHRLL
jgi:hypothetical protein